MKDPMGRATYTKSHIPNLIVFISAIPDLVIMSTVQLRVKRPNTIYLTECNPTWSNESEKIHQVSVLAFINQTLDRLRL